MTTRKVRAAISGIRARAKAIGYQVDVDIRPGAPLVVWLLRPLMSATWQAYTIQTAAAEVSHGR